MREKSLDIKKRDRCQFQEAELHHLRNRKSGCDHFIITLIKVWQKKKKKCSFIFIYYFVEQRLNVTRCAEEKVVY